MKTSNYVTATALIVLVTTQSIAATPLPTSWQSYAVCKEIGDPAQLQLTVLDPLGARISGAIVVVVQGPLLVESKTNAEGEVLVELRPGAYSISVAAGGFLDYKRPPIYIESRVSFKIVLLPVNYELIKLSRLTPYSFTCGSGSTGVKEGNVTYARMAKRSSSVDFWSTSVVIEAAWEAGRQWSARKYHVPVTVLVGAMTLSARHVRLDNRRNVIRADGDVSYSDGGSVSIRAKEAVLDLRTCELTIVR